MQNRIGGLSFFTRDSAGGLTVASYHPRSSATWYWSIGFGRRNGNRMFIGSDPRSHQRHDYLNIGPFGLRLSRQNYHKQATA